MEERERLGIEEEDEDMEIIVNRLEEVHKAVTLKLMQHAIHEDNTSQILIEDITTGTLRPIIQKRVRFKEVF